MLVGIDGTYMPPPPPPPKPLPPPKAPTAETPPQSPDRVTANDDDGFGARSKDWLKENSPAVAALAHGVVDAPGIVAREYRDAASTNAALSKQLDKTLSHWSTDLPSARDANIAELKDLAKGKSEPIEKLAAQLSAENTTPRLLHAVGVPASRAAGALGRSLKSSVDDAIASLPAALQGKARSIASHFEAKVSTFVDGMKSSAKARIAEALPSALDHRAGATVTSLDRVAQNQTAAAASKIRNGSRLIGYTPGDVAGLPAVDKAAPKVGNVLDHLTALRDTPILDYGLAGAGIFLDRSKGYADATVANVGSTLAGSETQGLLTKAVTHFPSLTTSSFGEAAGEATGEAVGETAVEGVAASTAGETAVAAVGVDAALPEVAGAVAATGPVGVAVVGTVVVGAVVAYGVTKIVESQAGQDIIGGVTHLDGARIEKGLDEAGNDVKHLGSDISSGFHKLTSWL